MRQVVFFGLFSILLIRETNAKFLEHFGQGFCTDSEGLFFERGQSQPFDDPESCLDHCLQLDASDLVGVNYKFSNKRCHCNYNVGSAVIAECDLEVFHTGCRKNQNYFTGSGGVRGTSGSSAWNCYKYDPTPKPPPVVPFSSSTTIPVVSPVASSQKSAKKASEYDVRRTKRKLPSSWHWTGQ